LEAAKSLRTDILDYQQDFYRDAKSEANKAKGSTIVFGGTKDAAKTTHLAEILNRHQIEIYELKEDTQQGGNEYKKGYSYAVPLNQKNHKLINAMFEKRTSFTDSLFYDVSAWTFPLAFDVKYDYVKSGSSILGDLKQDVQLKTGTVDGSGNYAFLMEWHEYYSPKALYEILSKELRAKVALKEFSLEGNSYDYGTIMIPAANQNMSPKEMRSFLEGVAERSHIEIKSVSTGLTEGIDLGSNNFKPLRLPKIAMIVGGRTSSYDAGEIWHLLDTRFDMPITKIDKEYFDRVDLSEYSTVIMVNGGNLDSSSTEKLKAWIRDGGNLVAYRYALNYLKSNEILDFETVKAEVKAENISFEQQSDFRGAQVIGGAIFAAKQDRSHPINFGYEDGDLSLFRNTTLFIKANSGNYLSPIQYLETPLQSGYISEENAAVIGNTVPFLSSSFGSGRVLGFTDNTNFRAFWYGTNKLLMNAIFFADMM
jgi:hypothetical protein